MQNQILTNFLSLFNPAAWSSRQINSKYCKTGRSQEKHTYKKQWSVGQILKSVTKVHKEASINKSYLGLKRKVSRSCSIWTPKNPSMSPFYQNYSVEATFLKLTPILTRSKQKMTKMIVFVSKDSSFLTSVCKKTFRVHRLLKFIKTLMQKKRNDFPKREAVWAWTLEDLKPTKSKNSPLPEFIECPVCVV